MKRVRPAAARTGNGVGVEPANLQRDGENAYMQVGERLRQACREDLLLHLLIAADLDTLKSYVLGIKRTLIKIMHNEPYFDESRLALFDEIANGNDYVSMHAIIFFAIWKHFSVMQYFVPDPTTGQAPKVNPKQMQNFRAKVLPDRFRSLLRGTAGQHLEQVIGELYADWTSLAEP